ncbi:hypothetical protein [Novosphingobium rosa]|uniref:hypothetical protein n=1 Tax=Novosphingobium rosa TaxID=76978 RepID=UPI000829FF9B|nr:hypothetical protein [Novosphingobium rosa]
MPHTAPAPTLTPFTQAMPQTFNTLLCDGATARGITSLESLLALHATLQAERPDCHVIATLDDLEQACYTSGHGADYHGLDDTDGHDLTGLSPDAYENGQHRGYLGTPSEFPIRLAKLQRMAAKVSFASLQGLLPCGDSAEGHDPVSINRDPASALGIKPHEPILFLYPPVACAPDAIAAFPNGYFSCDLNPMQNHALARHLAESYGLLLFGIGARLLGFRRATPLPAPTARRLAEDLASLYAGADSAMIDDLATVLWGQTRMLVRYTEE